MIDVEHVKRVFADLTDAALIDANAAYLSTDESAFENVKSDMALFMAMELERRGLIDISDAPKARDRWQQFGVLEVLQLQSRLFSHALCRMTYEQAVAVRPTLLEMSKRLNFDAEQIANIEVMINSQPKARKRKPKKQDNA